MYLSGDLLIGFNNLLEVTVGQWGKLDFMLSSQKAIRQPVMNPDEQMGNSYVGLLLFYKFTVFWKSDIFKTSLSRIISSWSFRFHLLWIATNYGLHLFEIFKEISIFSEILYIIYLLPSKICFVCVSVETYLFYLNFHIYLHNIWFL